VSIPSNFLGYQFPMSNGNGYTGLFASYVYSETYREYIQAQLNTILTAGQKYYVSFYVSLADSSVFATDDLGAYFSATAPVSGTYDSLTCIPQISNPQGQFLTNKTIWKKISGSFTAVGNEQYITIGNFKGDLTTDTLRLLPDNVGQPDYNSSYYYIDEFRVSPDSVDIIDPPVGVKDLMSSQRTVRITPNPVKDHMFIEGVEPSSIELIEIVDWIGKVVWKQEKFSSNRIDLPVLPSGIYTVLTRVNGQTANNKLIISDR